MGSFPSVMSPGVSFFLESTAVVGLLGGDEASSAVALTQTYARRKWLGWYNSPGSYVTGERFRSLASSAKPNVVFDGDSESGALSRREFVYADPSALFDHEGWFRGPIFNGIYSGTSIQTTGPLASWLLRKATAADCQKVKGRKAQPVTVTVAILQKADSPRQEVTFDHHSPPLAIVPIFFSLFTCFACGLYREWYALSMILLGILSRGFACLFIGSGDLVFDHPKPAEGSPPGDGILGSDQEPVLLKGSEDAVNSVCNTRKVILPLPVEVYMPPGCMVLLSTHLPNEPAVDLCPPKWYNGPVDVRRFYRRLLVI